MININRVRLPHHRTYLYPGALTMRITCTVLGLTLLLGFYAIAGAIDKYEAADERVAQAQAIQHKAEADRAQVLCVLNGKCVMTEPGTGYNVVYQVTPQIVEEVK